MRRFTRAAFRTAANQTYTAKANVAATSFRIRRTSVMRRMLRARVRLPAMARRDIDRLQGEIEELFADLWQVPRFSGLRHGFRPAVDCFHTDDPHQLTIVAELAGVNPDSVAISIEERALTISGERRRPRVDGQVYQQMEIEYGPFARAVQLTEHVDVASASATYEQGLLTVTLPIAKRPAPRDPVPIVVRHASGEGSE